MTTPNSSTSVLVRAAIAHTCIGLLIHLAGLEVPAPLGVFAQRDLLLLLLRPLDQPSDHTPQLNHQRRALRLRDRRQLIEKKTENRPGLLSSCPSRTYPIDNASYIIVYFPAMGPDTPTEASAPIYSDKLPLRSTVGNILNHLSDLMVV
jgi:hypothetical protein